MLANSEGAVQRIERRREKKDKKNTAHHILALVLFKGTWTEMLSFYPKKRGRENASWRGLAARNATVNNNSESY